MLEKKLIKIVFLCVLCVNLAHSVTLAQLYNAQSEGIEILQEQLNKYKQMKVLFKDAFIKIANQTFEATKRNQLILMDFKVDSIVSTD